MAEKVNLRRRVSILGVTGSVGCSAQAVIAEVRAQGGAIEVEAITAASNVAAALNAVKALSPRFVAMADPTSAQALKEACAANGLSVEIGAGAGAIIEAAQRPADWVLSAIVGAVALPPTLAAIQRGAHVALANKECLVSAGPVMLAAAEKSGAKLLPVDSEHNAIFQVLTHPDQVERIVLTASGGPFRTWTREAMASVTPAQALKHPKWSMGPKITIDSATLMNKGLELIEAALLFGVLESQIDVLVHPEAIIHSMVSYCDGSVLAQLSEPDMRVPIAYALAWPHRAPVSTKRLDLAALAQLNFEAPDEIRFPALGLARAALRAGGGVPAVLNAANEVAVDAFLTHRIAFLDIAAVVEEVLSVLSGAGGIANSPSSLDEVEAIDRQARLAAQKAAAARLAA